MAIKLIDFGLCTRYITSDESHIEEAPVSCFKGNLMFSSLNAMNKLTKGRRDDLQSLFYFIVYLSNRKNYAFALNHEFSFQQNFKNIKFLKKLYTISQICGKIIEFIEFG